MFKPNKKTKNATIAAVLLATLLAGCTPASPQPGSKSPEVEGNTSVYITEIMAKNSSTLADDDGDYSDYIELYNSSDSSVNLKGWYLSDNDKKPQKWQLPDISIPANSYLVIFASGKDRADAEKGIYHTNFNISGKGETITLITPDGVYASYIQLPESASDIPYCRVQQGSDAGKYAWFSQSSPGAPNTGAYAFTIEELPLDTDPLFISEYSMNNRYTYPDSEGNCHDFVELYNPSDKAVSLAGMSLTDDAQNPHKWSFPSNITIEPKGYLLIYLSGKDGLINGELHASFGIGKADTVLQLTNARGQVVDFVTLTPLVEGLSHGRSADDINKWLIYAKPTPGAANTTQGFDSLMAASALINKGVWINEVSSVPPETNTDNYDWIELYNGTNKAINLKGYGLSKDAENKFAYTFGDVTLNAGGYLLVYCSGTMPEKPTSGALYAPFKLSNSGETLFLTQPDGVVVDIFSTGKLRIGVTSGRAGTELGTRYFFATPTPKSENNRTKYTGYASMPKGSLPGGYAKAGDTFTLTTDSDQVIRYTTDGSYPTENSPKYQGPITLTKTTVIKARAFKEGCLPSDVLSATFFLGTSHDIPIVSLSTDPDNLFDHHKGILANGPGYAEPFPYKGANFWKDWERPITFEYFGAQGTKNFQFEGGVKVFGQYTRAYDRKSLAVFLRDKYGAGELNYPVFDGNPVTKFKSFVLRAGGQDQKFTHIRDAFAQEVMRGQTSLVMMDWQPVALYINGEYWGMFDLREKINEEYLETHEGIDKDNVDIIKGNSTVLAGSNKEYLALIDYVKTHDLTVAENYKYVTDRVDIDNFIDWLLVQIFFCNGDTGNKKCYKERVEGAKWRWIMFDLDMTLRVEALWDRDDYNMLKLMFNPAGHGSNNAFSTALQCNLIKNKDFKQKFINRYAELLNTTFMPERMLSILDGMVATIDTEMVKHGERWSRPTYSTWKDEIAGLRHIIEKRRNFAKDQFIKYFNLSAEQVQQLFPNG